MERLLERVLKKKSLECWKYDNAMNHWNIAQQPKTVGVAKVTSIPRNCSDELPEFGYVYNGSEV